MSERDIFTAALQIDDPAARAAYLDSACRDNADLRQRIEKLFGLHADAGSFLDQPAAANDFTGTFQPVTEAAGSVIGPYKLLQRLGEGGFGVVYMAEQSQPVRRLVALKIIKPGM